MVKLPVGPLVCGFSASLKGFWENGMSHLRRLEGSGPEVGTWRRVRARGFLHSWLRETRPAVSWKSCLKQSGETRYMAGGALDPAAGALGSPMPLSKDQLQATWREAPGRQEGSRPV